MKRKKKFVERVSLHEKKRFYRTCHKRIFLCDIQNSENSKRMTFFVPYHWEESRIIGIKSPAYVSGGDKKDLKPKNIEKTGHSAQNEDHHDHNNHELGK